VSGLKCLREIRRKMTEKKVLYVLSEFFAPNQNIGAVKFTKIVKFLLQKNEYEVYVFTRKNFSRKDEILEKDLKQIEELGGIIYTIDAGKDYYKKSKVKRIIRKYKRKLIKPNTTKEYVKKNSKGMKLFAKNGEKLLNSINIPAPDYMISTYDDYGAHILGERIKDKYGDKVFWITDFRDQVAILYQDSKTRTWADGYTKRITEKSDCTTVSAAMARDMIFAKNVKLKDIYIGYDPEDGEKIRAIEKALTFAYSGSYYGDRTISPLLQVICELADDGKIDKYNISFSYCGDYGEDLKKELIDFGLEDKFIDWGRVSHLQSMLIQNQSDILLSCIWNYYDYQGAMGGKTFEYLGLEKPIVAIVKGNMPNSDMKKFIDAGECGVCYEEANHDIDMVLLKEKIYWYYKEKQEKGYISHKNNLERVKRYDLNYIANQYDAILKTKGN